MSNVQPMDVDHPSGMQIMNASKASLANEQFNCCGISVDLYQFSHDPTTHWNKGHIFHANYMHDLSFGDRIGSSDPCNKREAAFIVNEAEKKDDVEDMMVRSLIMKRVGILKTYLAGYNSQISKAVSAFRVTTATFEAWLQEQKLKAPSTSIPPEVRELIRTAYLDTDTIWSNGYTSDSLADACSYHMIDNGIKIDPLHIRGRNGDENGNMSLRIDFAKMIKKYIYSVWEDVELLDFVDLLNNPKAGVRDILGAPVLLLPAERELMYHDLNKTRLNNHQQRWLRVHATPAGDWKVKASNADLALKKIIIRQKEKDKKLNMGFSLGWKGALRFGRVVAAHYDQHFRGTSLGRSGVEMKGRVDLLLKQVLPGLLSKRYNAKYI